MIRYDCYWYHCEHQMGASIDCCILAKGLGDCPCSDDCDKYISRMEVTKMLKAQQEPKIVKAIGNVGVSDVKFADCPWCAMRIHDDESRNYCGHCGMAVKWNG